MSLSFVGRLVCALAIAALPLAAQTGLGIVRGTVQDPTRASIPNAEVTLTSVATGVARATRSSEVGIYYFSAVPPGRYTLAVVVTGFKRWSGTLTLEAGQTAVVDPTMEVGTLEATVEVTGVAPVITTEGMEVGDVKDALRIEQLPLNGRAITNLFTLTPGVEGGGSPRVHGMKVGSTDMVLDGISLVDRFGGGMARVQPGLDTIQEFRIETVGSNAASSRPATIFLVTKSGTNELHGSTFWTHRNNFGGLRARRRQDGNVASQYIRNEYGASAGGPFIKNQMFWFVAYEGYRQRQSGFARASAPTPAMWDGDLSLAMTENSEQLIPYDPYSTRADGTRVAFPNRRIPSNRISEFSRTMRSVSPEPTSAMNPFLGSNFVTYYPDTADMGNLTAKVDHVFSSKDNLSGRFTRAPYAYKLFGGRFGYPKPGSSDAGGTGRNNARLYSGFVRWNRVFRPTFLNELQVSTNRAPKSSGTLADDTDWPQKLGLPNPFGARGWPTICSDSPFFYWGCWDADNRKDEMLTAHQAENNVTWIRGRHSIRFGGKLRYEYNNIRELQQAHGAHDFYSDWTSLYDVKNDDFTAFTGVGFGSVLMGLPTYLSNQYNRGYFYFEQQETGLYFHDSWKVHPRLTLELGLRWDMWTAYEEKYNRMTNLDLTTYASKFEVITPKNKRMEELPGIPPSVLASWKARGLTWTTANSLSGYPGNLIKSDHNNFGPRIGAAFRLTNKWILRGGYGEYFWTMPLAQILQSARTNPPLNLRFYNSIADQNGRVDFYSLKNAPGPNDPVGKATVPTEGIVPISTRSQSMMPWDANKWSDNRMQSWHFTVEHSLMNETALRLTYTGNHGRDLEQRFHINAVESEWNYQARTGKARPSNADLRRANPNWNLSPLNHTGYSNAHSLQAEVERRYHNGLAFQWFYTFSRSLTTNDTGGFTFGGNSINATDGQCGVPESIQMMGAPNLGYEQRQRLCYYNSGSVPAHRIRWNGIYDLPFGRNQRFAGSVSRGLDAVIGGWQLATIGDWRSGMWSSVGAGRFLFGDPTLKASERLEMDIFGRRQRLWFKGDFDPRQATNVDQSKLQQLIPLDRSQRVLTSVGSDFSNRIPQRLADGSTRLTTVTDMVNWNARNFFFGPGAWNVDLSLFKTFSITEKVKTRFTADFFNFFNHPLDVGPNSTT
ncbi:MAG: TonB-dependent receptor, partial [Acidobacteriota bacterium]